MDKRNPHIDIGESLSIDSREKVVLIQDVVLNKKTSSFLSLLFLFIMGLSFIVYTSSNSSFPFAIVNAIRGESHVFLKGWGSQGNGEGQLNNPTGIAVDSFGNVYVLDTGNNRIQKFDSNGTYI